MAGTRGFLSYCDKEASLAGNSVAVADAINGTNVVIRDQH